MASLVIFLCFSAFMFGAGYQWRMLREEHRRIGQEPGPTPPREAVWTSMLGKL